MAQPESSKWQPSQIRLGKLVAENGGELSGFSINGQQQAIFRIYPSLKRKCYLWLWGQQWHRSAVQIFCDNGAAVTVLSAGYSREAQCILRTGLMDWIHGLALRTGTKQETGHHPRQFSLQKTILPIAL